MMDLLSSTMTNILTSKLSPTDKMLMERPQGLMNKQRGLKLKNLHNSIMKIPIKPT